MIVTEVSKALIDDLLNPPNERKYKNFLISQEGEERVFRIQEIVYKISSVGMSVMDLKTSLLQGDQLIYSEKNIKHYGHGNPQRNGVIPHYNLL